MSSIAGVLANWSYFGQNLTIFAFNLPADISIGEILVIVDTSAHLQSHPSRFTFSL